MNERPQLLVALICGLTVAAAAVLLKQHQPNTPIAEQLPQSSNPPRIPSLKSAQQLQSPQFALSDAPIPPSQLVRSMRPTPTAANANPISKPRKKSIASGQPHTPPTLAAPQARIALALVGADPDTESVWSGAINDPFVPADERKDLVEDLNEDGFADPHHITLSEMPPVLSRIQLIEQLAPSAMDDTNAAAFKEAYKDLTNMLSDPNPR
jgi:hypothetical protein